MKRIGGVGCVVALVFGGAVGLAQEVAPASVESGTPTAQVQGDGQGLEVLSDVQGVDFKPYLKNALHQVYAQWLVLMPRGAQRNKEEGVTAIRFTISPDGTIVAMHLDGSAHDAALDRAAWGSIAGVGKFAALPSAFHGPNLELRIRFVVNGGA